MNRKYPKIQLDNGEEIDVINYLKKEWKLSVTEESVFDTFISAFIGSDLQDLKQLEQLMQAVYDRDWDGVLGIIPDYNVEFYAKYTLKMLKKDNCKNLGDYFDNDIIEEAKDRGLSFVADRNNSITEDLQFSELVEVWSGLDFISREKLLKDIKNG